MLKEIEAKYKNLVSKHWGGKPVTFTDVWCDKSNMRQLSEGELLPSELSAVVFTVGCYTIRSAQRVYMLPRNRGAYIPENEVPANAKYVGNLKKGRVKKFNTFGLAAVLAFAFGSPKHRIAHEISAKHTRDPCGAFVGGFKYVCRAAEATNLSWWEQISCIFTAKESSLPNDGASLFVCLIWGNSSMTSQTWYRLSPQGLISKFSIHPYGK